MIGLLLFRALAADCDVDAALVTLATPDAGLLDAYLCLASADAAGDRLEQALAPPVAEAGAPEVASSEGSAGLAAGTGDDATHHRQARALALWMLQRTDQLFEVEQLRRLTPADRRLLADGVRARRGRKSPSPEHHAIFQKFDWYKPVPGYTDGRLTALDRGNISLADRPPEPPRPPPPAAEEPTKAEAVVPTEVVKETPLCGCDGTGGAGLGALAVLLAAGMGRRSRAVRRG